MYEPRLFSRSITILNPSIRTCFSSTCNALAPSWTGAFVSAMRLRFFDGRAASVSTGGIDNDNTLSGSFGQPTAGSVAAVYDRRRLKGKSGDHRPPLQKRQLRTILRWRACSFPPLLLPTRHCMTQDRLRRGDCLRFRCEEDRAY